MTVLRQVEEGVGAFSATPSHIRNPASDMPLNALNDHRTSATQRLSTQATV